MGNGRASSSRKGSDGGPRTDHLQLSLRTIYEGSFKIAAKKEYRIGAISVIPDHLHVALRGSLTASPEEIALAFQNNLAYMVGRGAIWRPGYKVGTFGEYNMNAIRVRTREEPASPVTRGHGGRSEE